MREYIFGVSNKFPLQVVVDGHSCHLNLIIPALINKKKKKKRTGHSIFIESTNYITW